VSVKFRQPPEHRYPARRGLLCGLVWTTAHATELRIDLGMLAIVGASAGGGLACDGADGEG